MEFVVTREFNFNNSKPCDNAIEKKYTRIDVRTVSKPEDVPGEKGKSNWWYKEGTNHRLIEGYITRDLEDMGWFIEISSLEELIKFQNKNGNIIIRDYYFNTNLKEIKICDEFDW